MENASKALLIAGALLIVLATISLVMVIYNSGKDINEQVTEKIDQSILRNHNAQFTIYEKENLPYSELIKLVNTIINNNERVDNDLYKVTVTVTYEVGSYISTRNYTNKSILSSKYIDKESTDKGEEFKVELVYSSNGLINLIKIYKVK